MDIKEIKGLQGYDGHVCFDGAVSGVRFLSGEDSAAIIILTKPDSDKTTYRFNFYEVDPSQEPDPPLPIRPLETKDEPK